MRPKLALRESWNFAELSVLKVPAPLTPEPINRLSRLSSAPYPHDPETFQASANVTQKKVSLYSKWKGKEMRRILRSRQLYPKRYNYAAKGNAAPKR